MELAGSPAEPFLKKENTKVMLVIQAHLAIGPTEPSPTGIK
jgi:hypothetical protein